MSYDYISHPGRRSDHAGRQPEDPDPHPEGPDRRHLLRPAHKDPPGRDADRIERATDPGYLAFCSVICPKTSLKVLDGYGTSVAHMLTMAFDDPTVDGDLRTALTAHEIVLDQEWADVE